MKINLLAKSVSDKIAAGEVIERPVSIVKELVENSIDAESDSIVVEIKKGGHDYIRVTDNGIGIEKDEIEKAFVRHATSKIERESDLENLITLGFRGEALASISAVTRMEVVSKTSDEKTGIRLSIHAGDIISKSQVGCPDGTTMIIRDLFFNTPARLKFMKSESSDTSQITTFMSNIAVGFPEISFRYVVNGKIVFTTDGKGNLNDTIIQVYNHNDCQNLIEIKDEIPGLKIRGFISRPSINRNTRKLQIYLVNGRVIESKIIDAAIEEGYRERLFEGRFPIAFLLLELDPKAIDVNIHPNKKVIKFDDEKRIKDFIADSIHSAITSADSVPRPISESTLSEKLDQNPISASNSVKYDIEESDNSRDDYFVDIYAKPDQNSTKQMSLASILREEGIARENSSSSVEKEISQESEDLISKFDMVRTDEIPWKDVRPIGVVFATYILATDDVYFYIIDQHAAHERIYYEKFVTNYIDEGHSGSTTQLLAVGIVIDLTPQEESLIENKMSILQSLGFEIESFGPGSVIIRGVPDFMNMEEAEIFARNVIEDTDENADVRNQVAIDKLITKSCKSAVKANDYLTDEEVSSLLNTLTNCKNPYSCPHGRPTIIKFSKYEMERMFKRA
ncbi:MAG: DNA mismatch repair endonuclease MutL [Anaerovoracaceae bacterium]|nr:DNA mismatch repair endonuclease MutL [Anaerovoracaceae bacterium]